MGGRRAVPHAGEGRAAGCLPRACDVTCFCLRSDKRQGTHQLQFPLIQSMLLSLGLITCSIHLQSLGAFLQSSSGHWRRESYLRGERKAGAFWLYHHAPAPRAAVSFPLLTSLKCSCSYQAENESEVTPWEILFQNYPVRRTLSKQRGCLFMLV